MDIIHNYTAPTIKFYDSSKDTKALYNTFSVGDNPNLQRFSFNKSINNMVGSFNITFKDKANQNGSMLLDEVKLLDVVAFYENDDQLVFLGVIKNKSISSTAGTGEKLCTVSGLSIECLFDMFTISADVTAMAIFSNNIEISTVNDEVKGFFVKDESGTVKVKTIKELAQETFKKFQTIANEKQKISATYIGKLINLWYGDDFIKATEYNEMTHAPIDMPIMLPITTPLLQNATCTFISYLRTFLPENVYNFYGTIVNNERPQLIIEEMPFDNKALQFRKSVSVQPIQLTDYALTQSCEEIYTNFMAYIEGTVGSADFYAKATATEEGSSIAVANDDVQKYGYKPMFCSFVGYQATKEDSTNISTKLSDLNKRICAWYSNLDKFYNGSFTLMYCSELNTPRIGEWLRLGRDESLNAEFYVVNESHSWIYGSSITIKYDCIRGAVYPYNGVKLKIDDKGNYLSDSAGTVATLNKEGTSIEEYMPIYNELQNISRYLSEFENWGK